MISDLYYSKLGLSNPEVLKRNVADNLRDFQEYLYNAESRMKKRKFSFSYKVNFYVIKINSSKNKGKPDIFSADYISLDRVGYDLVQEIKVEEQEIVIHRKTKNRCIFAQFKNNNISYEYEIMSVHLKDIAPQKVNEEEEDTVLDLLYDSTDIYEDEDDNSYENKIHIVKGDPKNRTIALTREPKNSSFWITYNYYIIQRQRQAVEALAMRPKQHLIPLLKLFQPWESTNWKPVAETKSSINYYILTDESKSGCDEQRKFVRIAMNTPDFAILQGPPGSGKTTTLLELIIQESMRGKSILMVASTHVAVDNILERLEETTISVSGMKKTLMNACGIVPIRIGEEANVSENIRKYCINRLVETEKKRLLKELENIEPEQRSQAQDGLYTDLIKDDKNGEVETFLKKILLDSANLVCGTTIGVLQAPMIQKVNSLKPLFDVVILDEASKTTFQEFLVPALYGKKWIISGDIKQLAPYVDREPIIYNLKNLKDFEGNRGFEDKKICLSAFLVARNYLSMSKNKRTGILLISTQENTLGYANYVNKQVDGLNSLLKKRGVSNSSEISQIVINQKPTSLEQKLEVLGSNFIITSKDILDHIVPYLPPNIQTLADREVLPPVYVRRRRAYTKVNNNLLDKQTWEDHIEWRISRMYELRGNHEKYNKLKLEIEMLLPYFERNKGNLSLKSKEKCRCEKVSKSIDQIRRVALPSVLELLQNGLETNSSFTHSQVKKIVLYQGLKFGGEHREIFDSRHVLLTYQHRMHPEISAFPRNYIYKGEALKDAKDVKNNRDWNFGSQYPSRSIWIDVKPKKTDYVNTNSPYNIAEVNLLIRELKDFINWAKDHPNIQNKDRCWSIALLSFYKGQINKISQKLQEMRELFGLKGKYYDFSSKEYNVTIKISTVDRYQGHEADVVYLSFVRCRFSSIGFLDNANRLNVAITRAKYQIIMFGDKKRFENENIPLLNLLVIKTADGTIRYR